MSIHPLDAAILAVTPTVVAPKYGSLEPLTGSGQRYVVGRDGLYMEIRRPFIHITMPVSLAEVPTPYGDVKSRVALLCGKPPVDLFKRFKREAADAAPNEHAAWLTWSQHTGQWYYREVGITNVSRSEVRYDRPQLADGEWLVVDMHSHGTGPAGFSLKDDKDDYGAVKVALVLGHCDTEDMSHERRICALGSFLDRRWISAMEVPHEASAV